jgi:hypothetical protein
MNDDGRISPARTAGIRRSSTACPRGAIAHASTASVIRNTGRPPPAETAGRGDLPGASRTMSCSTTPGISRAACSSGLPRTKGANASMGGPHRSTVSRKPRSSSSRRPPTDMTMRAASYVDARSPGQRKAPLHPRSWSKLGTTCRSRTGKVPRHIEQRNSSSGCGPLSETSMGRPSFAMSTGRFYGEVADSLHRVTRSGGIAERYRRARRRRCDRRDRGAASVDRRKCAKDQRCGGGTRAALLCTRAVSNSTTGHSETPGCVGARAAGRAVGVRGDGRVLRRAAFGS